jgi:perosamine synthetase
MEFEKSFSTKLGIHHALGVSSATAGLHMAMLALDIKDGDEVILPAKTFVSTANAIVFCRGRPVFCDVDEKTMNMDPVSLKKKITSKTKAVIPVHVAGQPCNMDEIVEICGSNAIHIVEDSAHAPYALYKGRPAGTFGVIGVYSFYPDKVIASCDGGMVVSNDRTVAEKLHLLRNVGRRALGDPEVHMLGYNYRMNEFQAALALEQLNILNDILEKRRFLASYYDELLSNMRTVEIPFLAPNRDHDYYAYIIRLLNTEGQSFQFELSKQGIETSIMFEPVYLHDPYIKLYGDQRGSCPVAERMTYERISIPLHPQLKSSDLDYVVDVIRKTTAA